MKITICMRCNVPVDHAGRCDCRPLSTFGEVLLTAAAIDGRKSGPIDGDALHKAARARKELPS